MGVETIYNPFSIFSIIFIFIFIVSCTPANNQFEEDLIVVAQPKTINTPPLTKIKKVEIIEKKQFKKKQIGSFSNYQLKNEIEVILPYFNYSDVTKHLINSLELSIYKKQINNTELNINKYANLRDLENLLNKKAKPGIIFIGTLNSEASKIVKNFCSIGIVFFSFASDKSLADDCVYLINFFPEDDLIALFNYFPKYSKVTLLYPENIYGYNINSIIDPIANKSNSVIVNRASYKEDLTNAREAIKELGKYELRKYELDRQKKILQAKNDDISKKALIKIDKFETLGKVDFTHLILPDYSIRLLEIAPLLPFYDVDPNVVQFVGTGVWDDEIFFKEPSLQGAIFSGIEESIREDFFNEYENIYKVKPIRTATIPYDLLGIISYMLDQNMTLGKVYALLDNNEIKFEGIDGKFSFINNIIFRELDILKISKGRAFKLN